MTDNNHPITPPPELLSRWEKDWHYTKVKHIGLEDHIAHQAARWGSDQELEACVKYFHEYDSSWGENSELITGLRAARRPKPPSLKEQALAALNVIEDKMLGPTTEEKLIRKALEMLPND